MSLALLKTLVAVAEHGSFAAAAQSINLTQAAVGQQMKRLEQHVGAALFDRDSGVPKLNPTGLSLIPKARSLIADYASLLDEVTGDTRLEGEFSLGAVPSAIRALVPQSLGKLRVRAPLLHVRVVPGLSAELVEQVERGGVGAAITSKPGFVSPALVWQEFAREPLVLLAASDLPGDDPIQLLKTMPYIAHTRRAAVGQMADLWLSEHDVSVHVAMEMESLESVASMVAYNLGVSIVPDICVPDVIFSSLRRIALPGLPAARTVGLLSRADVRQRVLVDALFEELCHTIDPSRTATLG